MLVTLPTLLPRPPLYPKLLPRPLQPHPGSLRQGCIYKAPINLVHNFVQDMNGLSEEEGELEDEEGELEGIVRLCAFRVACSTPPY